MLLPIVASIVDGRLALRTDVNHLSFDDVRREIVLPSLVELWLFGLAQRAFSQTLIHSNASRNRLIERCYQELPDL